MTSIPSIKARLQWASLFVPAAIAFHAGAAPAPGAPAEAAHYARPLEYSVINLGRDAGSAVLNGRGQAAFTSVLLDDRQHGFFDGRRIHAVGLAGGSYSYVNALNDHGVVVGELQTATGDYRAFAWTAARGLRVLPRNNAVSGPASGAALAINNRNQIVGRIRSAVGIYPLAARWNPDGSLAHLAPQTARTARAVAINDSGMAVGEAEVTWHDNHAIVWNPDGTAIDLGTFGGDFSTATQVNAGGQVLGHYYKGGNKFGFLWSRRYGMVPVGPTTGFVNFTALNDAGEVAGSNMTILDSAPSLQRPFIWSWRAGVRSLPMGGAPHGEVLALNNQREMVGLIDPTPNDGDSGSRRATYWNGVASPIDLNTRLYRAPAGLVLYVARAINDGGTILADSNAGLVMLRPGREGTPAPVLGPIFGGAADGVVALGATVDFTVPFVDSAVAESHLASASVSDGCPQPVPSLRERRGQGDVSVRHTFCRPGYASLKIRVTDRAGNATQVERLLLVADPSAKR
ncbi:hypothetical protein LK542_03770 [Massilia sp. IC2-477]|uniref:hypothetical protein n=1 Tax=Massilia sp. IC2-477 TaxID=2887198 RepID=UPI001D10FF94|nr:hypothetical protein [Massilia sp. IC2-477]MCC2954732.1 hypothetical protein [Massilia sp. IC2-477]